MATGRVPTTANSPLTAKGDLFGYSTTQARVPVGNDGETLVADSSTSTGLRWQGNFAAGKNAVINGDFRIWQRGTSFSGNSFGADRWYVDSDATLTTSQQTFTAGAAPVAGYEAPFFIRYAKSAGGTYMAPRQRIEDVRTFAGQTVTMSFWAKADATVTIAPYYQQVFGTGGSTTVGAQIATQSITTSWARYSFTVTLPSISGKTIGTGSYLEMYTARYVGSAATTIDVWGVQVEAGNVATAFQTATGTLAGELAACQRYYFRASGNSYSGNASVTNYPFFGPQLATSSTAAQGVLQLPVPMRVYPTSLEFLAAGNYGLQNAVNRYTLSAIALDSTTVWASPTTVGIVTTSSGLTSNTYYYLVGNFVSTAYIGVSAEL